MEVFHITGLGGLQILLGGAYTWRGLFPEFYGIWHNLIKDQIIILPKVIILFWLKIYFWSSNLMMIFTSDQ